MSQLVNADDTSVLKLRHNSTLKANRNYIFARFLTKNNRSCTKMTFNNGYSDAPIKKFSRVILFKVHADN